MRLRSACFRVELRTFDLQLPEPRDQKQEDRDGGVLEDRNLRRRFAETSSRSSDFGSRPGSFLGGGRFPAEEAKQLMSYSFILSRSMNNGSATAAFSRPNRNVCCGLKSICWPSSARASIHVKELVKEEEKEAQHELDQRIIHIEPHADARRKVAHQRLDDAEHPDRMLAQRILS